MDYVTKPFNMKELSARISVHLRNAERMLISSELAFRDIVLNTNTHTVKINNMEIKLTRTEYAILKLIMQNPAQVVCYGNQVMGFYLHLDCNYHGFIAQNLSAAKIGRGN